MSHKFNAHSFWESRLKETGSIYKLVGHRAFGAHWNKAIYQRRFDVMAQFMANFPEKDLANLRVADCGAGFGLFWPFWQQYGIAEYTAIELSSDGVAHIQNEFAASASRVKKSVIQSSVTHESNTKSVTDKTIVTFIDVFYHLVNDEEFSAALLNGWRMLASGGFLVFTDSPRSRDFFSGEHVHFRTISTYARLLGKQKNDFRLMPLFSLLQPPEFPTAYNRFLRLLWGPMALCSKRIEFFDKVFSGLIYEMDTYIFSRFPRLRSSSTSLVIVQK